MRSLASYLLLILMVMFWICRIVVAFTTTLGIDIGVVPMNMNMEIILLFITIPCIILVGKRKLLGAILYLIAYGAYFGIDLYKIIMEIWQGVETIEDYGGAIMSFIGIIIPIAIFFNLLVDKARMTNPVNKKTDWFYKNEEFDRKLDERVDKNQYRNY